jgi:hypothetical protein
MIIALRLAEITRYVKHNPRRDSNGICLRDGDDRTTAQVLLPIPPAICARGGLQYIRAANDTEDQA